MSTLPTQYTIRIEVENVYDGFDKSFTNIVKREASSHTLKTVKV